MCKNYAPENRQKLLSIFLNHYQYGHYTKKADKFINFGFFNIDPWLKDNPDFQSFSELCAMHGHDFVRIEKAIVKATEKALEEKYGE
jgi:hypothetical protein